MSHPLQILEIGRQVGRAIARDVIAEDMPRVWTGIDPQDGDILTGAGIAPDTPEWDAAEKAAEAAYHAYLERPEDA